MCTLSTTNEPSPGPNLSCAPVSQTIDSATLANLSVSPKSMVIVDLEQLEDAAGPDLTRKKPPTMFATSMPSDEYRFVRNERADSAKGLQASSVTKSSLLLADHLMDVLEGKEGSDDAVLEEMDNLRTLLFDIEHNEPSMGLRADSSGTGESILEGGMEVTLDDFISRDQYHQQVPIRNVSLGEDEWFDRMMHYALDVDSDLKADDASREECPDLTDPRQGEDRIRMDLGEIRFAGAAAHECDIESSGMVATLGIMVTENKKLLEASVHRRSNIPDDWNSAAIIISDNTPDSLVSTPKGSRDDAGECTNLVMDANQENFD